MRHVLSVIVENRPGVLTRVAGLFSRRGFNIDSIAVGEIEDKDLSRMTILVEGDEKVIEQVIKQLNKLIDVVKISNLTNESTVNRELVLIKVKAEPSMRAELQQLVETFRAKIVDVSLDSIIVEVTGDEEKIKAFELLLKHFGIQELVRTGKIAMMRGVKFIKMNGEGGKSG